MNIPDEVIYGAIGALYLGHAAFQKRQFKRLEKSADACEEHRTELQEEAVDHAKRIGCLEQTVNMLAAPCPTTGCQRNDIIDEATSLQRVRPAIPTNRQAS